MSQRKNKKIGSQSILETPIKKSNQTIGNTSIWDFGKHIWQNKENRKLLLGSFLLSLILFFLLKQIYPLPDLFSDAHSYIYAASLNAKVYYRPFGYSKFLQIIYDLSKSINFGVWIQVILFSISNLLLFFSIDYLIGFANKILRFIVIALLTINPIGLFLANFLVSDSLFVSLTIIWITSLLWIVLKPKWWWIAIAILSLYFAFWVRYSALFYPFVTAAALLLTPKLKLIPKCLSLLIGFLLIISAYSNIKKDVYQETGADVFAGFNGWQMANNVLYYYKAADFDRLAPTDDQDVAILDTIVRIFIDSMPVSASNGSQIGATFLWDRNSPLKKYTQYYNQKYKVGGYFASWYQVSSIFSTYANERIKEKPSLYFKYFILNNAKDFLIPPYEVFDKYDQQTTTIPESTKSWYNVKRDQLYFNGNIDYQKILLAPYPYIHLILLLTSFIFPIWALLKFRRTQQTNPNHNKLYLPLVLWMIYFMCHCAFTILAAPVVLRYETGFIFTAICFSIISIDKLIESRKVIIDNHESQ